MHNISKYWNHSFKYYRKKQKKMSKSILKNLFIGLIPLTILLSLSIYKSSIGIPSSILLSSIIIIIISSKQKASKLSTFIYTLITTGICMLIALMIIPLFWGDLALSYFTISIPKTTLTLKSTELLKLSISISVTGLFSLLLSPLWKIQKDKYTQ